MAGVLAFDLSLTATGWAIGQGKYGVLPGRYDGIQRLIYNRNSIMNLVDVNKPDLVIMEDLAFGANMPYAKEIAGLAYMIRAELHADGIQWCVVAPMSLKKFCCGTAGSKKDPVRKDRIMKDLAVRFGHDVNDSNIADAIVLAYIGMALMGDWTPTTEAQRDVLEKLRKANPKLSSLDKVGAW